MNTLRQIFLSEKLMKVAIAISAIVIFILSFPEWESLTYMLLLDQLFILLFALEA